MVAKKGGAKTISKKQTTKNVTKSAKEKPAQRKTPVPSKQPLKPKKLINKKENVIKTKKEKPSTTKKVKKPVPKKTIKKK
ncbi:conserved Plasmodium protein, unknown function [Plasmodium knowlesi strain H]|uniref:Uncharacterized protein n=3 Tax=Plasmodium knowlesi TaxID=5850 RepID=A0A5K1TVZ1_PLAKH|nr:conserved Plasmodium protein, unknown function [Plasmodium knowlesi strain H]OTN65545.1 Uncharacterized protein PKNOH_S110103800 [Plasmodium knowlesi]CAA9989657.1 conserved Plasmodium protein, unknown function [Plasmodium knowlesi strain H]SBO22772.1 conserved Plasmodium protein, unknown function [Plasmodium knowlesi strain H]SBO23129.1 conserved Plasmodium protein, unknown function [Plasmodium knowlesi strain H]VVS79131.1 conserved Plasmodium protein, unknown function [Plasmodium knowlesi |eukprot:XP_002260381.1 hypothetical protein, conserved in Plasmodium species [Plasmodium knowlesi strain H]